MANQAPVVSGNDLRELRRGLAISDESFAKYLRVSHKHYRKAERFGEKPIDYVAFKKFLETLVVVSPQMIMAKMQNMQKIADGLKLLSTKLMRTEKWLNLEKRGEEKTPSPVEELEEKEARLLESGGSDKRSCCTTKVEDVDEKED